MTVDIQVKGVAAWASWCKGQLWNVLLIQTIAEAVPILIGLH
jgi:hypothetical protein